MIPCSSTRCPSLELLHHSYLVLSPLCWVQLLEYHLVGIKLSIAIKKLSLQFSHNAPRPVFASIMLFAWWLLQISNDNMAVEYLASSNSTKTKPIVFISIMLISSRAFYVYFHRSKTISSVQMRLHHPFELMASFPRELWCSFGYRFSVPHEAQDYPPMISMISLILRKSM